MERDASSMTQDADFIAANMRETINGYMYGNLNSSLGLKVSMGSRVRWSIIDVDAASSSSSDSVMWEHNTVADSTGHFDNSVTMSSPGYAAVDMNPQEVGQWILSSGSETRRSQGMIATYMVEPTTSSGKGSSSTDSSSSLGRGTVFGLFVAIVVIGVISVAVMSLYMVKSALNLPVLRGDLDLILPDSSYHMSQEQMTIMLNPRQQGGESLSSGPATAGIKSVEL